MTSRDTLIYVIAQHPQYRPSALEKLAEIARQDLHDVPPFSQSSTWHSFAACYDNPEALNPPDWKLTISEGAECVAGLQHELSKSTDRRAPRWVGAADLLRFCLEALDNPDYLTAERIRRMGKAATHYDTHLGRETLKRKQSDLEKARDEKQRRTRLRHNAITDTYLAELEKHGNPDRAIRKTAKLSSVAERTVKRAIKNLDTQ